MSKTVSAFFLVLILAFAWRCIGLTFDSLWLDEGYQSIVDAYGRPLPDFTAVVDHPFIFNPGQPADPTEMLQNFRKLDPLTPPLYQLLLNRWITVFGGSDVAVRMLSVLISTICVGALFAFTHRAFGLKTALFTGLIQAFSPFDVYYGQEVRMYGLVALTATISCGLLFLLLLHRLRGRARILGWVAYVVATWALINSHYTGLFVVLFQGMLGIAFVLMRRSWRLMGILAAAWMMVCALWLPWFQMFLQAAKLRTASFYVARQPTLWWPFFALFVRIPMNWIVFLSGKQVVAPAIPILGTSVLSLLACVRAVPRLDRARRIMFGLVVLWAVIPAVGLWLIDVIENHRVIEIARYVMATAPAVYVLAGVGFAGVKRRNRWAIGIIVLHFLCATINNIAHATVVHQREPWRELAHILEEKVPNDRLVLVAQPYNIVCLDRYLKTPYRQVGVSPIMPREHLSKVINDASEFALITAQEGEAITSMMPPNYQMLEHIKLAHGLHLRRYRRQ